MSAREESLLGATLINRREYLRMLLVASGGLLLGTGALASGIFRRHGSGSGPARLVAERLEPGETADFSYPGPDDPAIAMRLAGGELVAYSSVCTHLACAVLWSRDDHLLVCPCHNGAFDERTGEVRAGPPPRRLPRIVLEERAGGVYATGTEG